LRGSTGGLNVEPAADSDRNSSGVDGCVLAAGYNSTNEIAGSEPEDGLLSGKVPAGKSLGREPGPLVGASAHAGNLEDQALPPGQALEVSRARGIPGIALRDPESRSVPLRSAPRGGFHGQAGSHEHLPDGPAGGIDGRRILKRLLGASKDAVSPLKIGRQELCHGLVALSLIAALTAQGEVGHPTGTPSDCGDEVLNFRTPDMLRKTC
jgi:hypothetical protein